MTRMHRDRVIPRKSSPHLRDETKPHSRFLAIARRVRWLFIIGIGGILSNGYVKVFSTKTIYHGPLKAFCVPFLNCHACPTAFSSCPIGILQSHAVYRKWPILLTGFLGTVGCTVGRAACGWLCPFGWLQDVMHKIKSKKFGIPKPLLKMKYVTLVVLAVLLPFATAKHWFSWLCPWGTVQAGIPWVLWNPVNPTIGEPVISPDMLGWHYVLKIAVLAGFLVWFILAKRPFCRTACPLGAIYSLFNRFSFLQMNVKGACRECGLCRKVCPMDIHIASEPKSPECIRCLECTVCKRVNVEWGLRHG